MPAPLLSARRLEVLAHLLYLNCAVEHFYRDNGIQRKLPSAVLFTPYLISGVRLLYLFFYPKSL
jgi:hypothetical protein